MAKLFVLDVTGKILQHSRRQYNEQGLLRIIYGLDWFHFSMVAHPRERYVHTRACCNDVLLIIASPNQNSELHKTKMGFGGVTFHFF
jgi:hypothetical protein